MIESHVEGAQISVIERRCADEDAGFRSCELGRPDPGIFQRFPGQFQGQALLGVHLLGFAGRKAESGRIEAPNIVQDARRPCIAAPALARAGMTDAL
jgi:hypothetical protein